MSVQIFKDNIPSEVLIGLLECICVFKGENYYVINNSSFKKAQFKNLLGDFIKTIEPYYHASKLFYLQREMTYTNFLTIIRQVCNSACLNYKSNIKYVNSKYEINYYIYF